LLTDISVAVVGFSGVVAAVAYRGSKFEPLDQLRIFTMLLFALCGTFGSLGPFVAESFGANQVFQWRFGAGFLALLLAFSILATFVAAWRLEPDDRAKLQPSVWILVVGGNSALTLWLVVSMVIQPGPGPIVISLIWQLFLSVLLFVRLILSPRPLTDR
jgi:hypothetical protein